MSLCLFYLLFSLRSPFILVVIELYIFFFFVSFIVKLMVLYISKLFSYVFNYFMGFFLCVFVLLVQCNSITYNYNFLHRKDSILFLPSFLPSFSFLSLRLFVFFLSLALSLSLIPTLLNPLSFSCSLIPPSYACLYPLLSLSYPPFYQVSFTILIRPSIKANKQ